MRMMWLCLFALLGFSDAASRISEAKLTQTKKSTATQAAKASKLSPQALGVQALTAEESFAILNPLNEHNKIFPKSYWVPLAGYKNLKPDNCFGVRLANGQRLAGESSGTGGLYAGFKSGADGKSGSFIVIGVFHSEFPFRIGSETLRPGPYLLQAYADKLELVGEHESQTRYDSFRRETVPEEKKVTLTLSKPLPEALLEREANETPRFIIGIETSAIVLTLHGNKWTVIPQI